MTKHTIVIVAVIAAVVVGMLGWVAHTIEKVAESFTPGAAPLGTAQKATLHIPITFVNLATSTDFSTQTFQVGEGVDTADINLSYDPEDSSAGQLITQFQTSQDGSTWYNYTGVPSTTPYLVSATSTPFIFAPASTSTTTSQFTLTNLNTNYLKMIFSRKSVTTVYGTTVAGSNGNVTGSLTFTSKY